MGQPPPLPGGGGEAKIVDGANTITACLLPTSDALADANISFIRGILSPSKICVALIVLNRLVRFQHQPCSGRTLYELANVVQLLLLKREFYPGLTISFLQSFQRIGIGIVSFLPESAKYKHP